MAQDWELVNKVHSEIEKVIDRGHVILLVKNDVTVGYITSRYTGYIEYGEQDLLIVVLEMFHGDVVALEIVKPENKYRDFAIAMGRILSKSDIQTQLKRHDINCENISDLCAYWEKPFLDSGYQIVRA